MRPVQWEPPIELSATERVIVKRMRRAKLFIFLREHRHEVFDAAFQEELASLYQDSPRGQPPVSPALLALATILQAYTGGSDDEVIEASQLDRKSWLRIREDKAGVPKRLREAAHRSDNACLPRPACRTPPIR